MGAIICKDDVGLVRHGFDKMAQEVTSGFAKGFAMKRDDGEFARAINGHEEIEPALRSLHLGNVAMADAEGVALELLLRGQIAVYLGKTADPMPLQTTVQRRPRQMRGGRLQGTESVAQRQERVPAKGHRHGLLRGRQYRRSRFSRAGRDVGNRSPVPPLGAVFWFTP